MQGTATATTQKRWPTGDRRGPRAGGAEDADIGAGAGRRRRSREGRWRASSREPPPWSAGEGAPSELPGPGRIRRRCGAEGPPGGRDAAGKMDSTAGLWRSADGDGWDG
jgi:hypothetical protein